MLIKLLSTHSDNNVKLTVLARLAELKQRQPRVLQELLLDLLRGLASPAIEVCLFCFAFFSFVLFLWCFY